MYIEAVLKGYKLLDVPPNPELRESLRGKSLRELETMLSSYKTLHNKTDVEFELVKNCYDANAQNVHVEFHNVGTKNPNSKIIIRDDGLVMTLSDIKVLELSVRLPSRLNQRQKR